MPVDWNQHSCEMRVYKEIRKWEEARMNDPKVHDFRPPEPLVGGEFPWGFRRGEDFTFMDCHLVPEVIPNCSSR